MKSCPCLNKETFTDEPLLIMTLSSENFLYFPLIKSICDNSKSKKEKERDVYMTMINKDAFDKKKKVGFKFKHVLFFFYPFIFLTDDCFFQNTKDE